MAGDAADICAQLRECFHAVGPIAVAVGIEDDEACLLELDAGDGARKFLPPYSDLHLVRGRGLPPTRDRRFLLPTASPAANDARRKDRNSCVRELECGG
jgi:hypothetical protein